MKLKKLLSLYRELSIHKNKIKSISENAKKKRSFKKVKNKKKDKHQSAREVLQLRTVPKEREEGGPSF